MPEHDLIQNTKTNFDKALEHLKSDLESIRTNRATPALIENLPAEVHGARMPVNQLASINVRDPKTLAVEPWNKPNIQSIEKAIQTASLGLSVANEGTYLRVTVPPMTEESRKEILKILNQKLENAKNSLRNIRDKTKNEITQAEKSKSITTDERYQLVDELDKTTREYNDKIKEMGEKKEEEIKL